MSTTKYKLGLTEGRIARLKFLKLHPELWTLDKRQLVKRFKEEGLLSPATYYLDVQIDALLAEVKKEAQD